MKLLAITSALLITLSSAAAIANPTTATSYDDSLLKTRDADADAAPAPGWWGYRWSPHGSAGFKRDANAAPEAIPRWWGYRWSRHGQVGFKRDAAPVPVPGWWGFRWSRHGQSGFKRDVAAANTAGGKEEDQPDFIYLPKGMTPDDLAAMIKDSAAETETKA